MVLAFIYKSNNTVSFSLLLLFHNHASSFWPSSKGMYQSAFHCWDKISKLTAYRRMLYLGSQCPVHARFIPSQNITVEGCGRGKLPTCICTKTAGSSLRARGQEPPWSPKSHTRGARSVVNSWDVNPLMKVLLWQCRHLSRSLLVRSSDNQD